MENKRIEFLDKATRISVVIVDCTKAAGALSRGHLCGPTAANFLSQALAGVALLGTECGNENECVTLRLNCDGALGGFLVEATDKGTLRGYTKKKILNDFDGVKTPSDVEALGNHGTFEVVRSVPGAIVSSGATSVNFEPRKKCAAVAAGLNSYFATSLQRKVRVAIAAAASDDAMPIFARGVMVECAPDGDDAAYSKIAELFDGGIVAKALSSPILSERTILKKIGLASAELRKTTDIAFACRCSPEKAKAMLAAIPEAERASLPEKIDITCHMCGRTWSVPTR